LKFTILVEYVKFRENLHNFIVAVFGRPLGQTFGTIYMSSFCPRSVRNARKKNIRRRYSWIGQWQLPIGRQMIPYLYLQRFGRNLECSAVACSRHPRAPIVVYSRIRYNSVTIFISATRSQTLTFGCRRYGQCTPATASIFLFFRRWGWLHSCRPRPTSIGWVGATVLLNDA